LLDQEAGDGEVENGVAEELEPLVRGRTVRRPVRVREDELDPLRRKRVDQTRQLLRPTGRRPAEGAATGGW
jgi:hypothetical protein